MTSARGPNLDRETAQQITSEASTLMKQGMALRAQPGLDGARQALVCFEQALDLRCRLPVSQFPVFQYDLAACWLNIAEVRAGFGTSEELEHAISSYDEAIALLGRLPLDEDRRFARRLAIAYQNRALAIEVLNPAAFDQIASGFRDAIATLAAVPVTELPDRDYLLAAMWVNLGNVHLRDSADTAVAFARDAASRAISLMRGSEAEDLNHTDVGLRARHLFCRSIEQSLIAVSSDTDQVSDSVHETTDVIDEALTLVGEWERRGVTSFRSLASELFRFGAYLYARHQPQFLGEYIADGLDPARSSAAFVESSEMQTAANDVAAAMQPAPRLTIRLVWPQEFLARESDEN